MPEDTQIEIKQGRYQAFVYTEGKTDWKHLEKAMQKLSLNLSLRFYDKEDCIGDRNLLDLCESLSKTIYPQEKPLIFVFDRNNPQVVKEVSEEGKPFKHWGNNVYSLAIPLPSHRLHYENVSIEFYYSDAEIKTHDTEGRRLKGGGTLLNKLNYCEGAVIIHKKVGPFQMRIAPACGRQGFRNLELKRAWSRA